MDQQSNNRRGKMVAAIMATLACTIADTVILLTGRTSGLGGVTNVYSPTHGPSQFWFTVTFFALIGVGGWLVRMAPVPRVVDRPLLIDDSLEQHLRRLLERDVS